VTCERAADSTLSPRSPYFLFDLLKRNATAETGEKRYGG
jgi:hypothetical protein